MYKADVVLARVLKSGKADEGNIVGDCCVVIEWKCTPTEGAEREGSCYAMHLCDVTKRRKFLVLTVSDILVKVLDQTSQSSRRTKRPTREIGPSS